MPRYTVTDAAPGLDLSFAVDWGMPGSHHYPAEGPTVHGIVVTRDGQLVDAETSTALLAEWHDEALILVAKQIEERRRDDAADHARDEQRNA